MTLVGSAGDGQEAVRLAGQVHPDVVLMDVRMAVMSGIEATRAVVPDSPDKNALNRDIWYSVKGFDTPYPGDSKVVLPSQVPPTGATEPTIDRPWSCPRRVRRGQDHG